MVKHTMRMPVDLEEAMFLNKSAVMTLHMTLRALARAHGGKEGPWLDELYAVCVNEAKGTISTFSHETEAAGVELGLQLIEIMFRCVRNDILVGKLDE